MILSFSSGIRIQVGICQIIYYEAILAYSLTLDVFCVGTIIYSSYLGEIAYRTRPLVMFWRQQKQISRALFGKLKCKIFRTNAYILSLLIFISVNVYTDLFRCHSFQLPTLMSAWLLSLGLLIIEGV